MFDIYIPQYVWICGLLLLFTKEVRQWCEMILEHDRFETEFKHECEEDAKNKILPESVKHLYS